MRPGAVLADRRQSVREAAQEWLQAGWIDANVFQNIEKMYPDDRVRAGVVFRVLFFVLTLAAIAALLGAVYSIINRERAVSALALLTGVACWGITSCLVNSSKRRGGGIEAAFSVAAVVNLMIGFVPFFLDHNVFSHKVLIPLLLAVLSGVAAWVWGYWPYAALSAASFFAAVVQSLHQRMLWIALVAVLYQWLVKGCDSPKLPPSLRKCSAAFLVVSMLGLYAGTNVFLLDGRYLYWSYEPEVFPRWLSIILTAILPLIIFGIGIAKRRRLFWVLGFVLCIFSLITMRMYVHVAPPWAILSGAGILLMASAGLLRRLLDSGRDAEWAGYTAVSHGKSDRHKAAEILVSMARFTPGASVPEHKSGFEGGGGEFGGGGASGKF